MRCASAAVAMVATSCKTYSNDRHHNKIAPAAARSSREGGAEDSAANAILTGEDARLCRSESPPAS